MVLQHRRLGLMRVKAFRDFPATNCTKTAAGAFIRNLLASEALRKRESSLHVMCSCQSTTKQTKSHQRSDIGRRLLVSFAVEFKKEGHGVLASTMQTDAQQASTPNSLGLTAWKFSRSFFSLA
jgi:hypothetical protein